MVQQDQQRLLQFNKLEHQAWLREPPTVRLLSYLKLLARNQVNQCITGASVLPVDNLRCNLTKTAAIETLITRIENGDLDETKLL